MSTSRHIFLDLEIRGILTTVHRSCISVFFVFFCLEARTDDSLNRTLLSPSPSPSIFRRIINRGQSPNAQEESSTNVNSTTTSKYMQQRKASVDRNTKTTPESQVKVAMFTFVTTIKYPFVDSTSADNLSRVNFKECNSFPSSATAIHSTFTLYLL